jgi:TIR domain
VRIFLSHASEQADVAETVGVALQAEGHTVFRDRSTLPSGEGYNDRIREAIADSDLFIFLVSPEAVTRGRYTITELEFAERRWPNPDGHLLPVMVKPTEFATIPAYLRAVTFLEPRGNLPAEVVAAVAAVRPGLWRRISTWVAIGVIIAILGTIGTWGALKRRAVMPRSDTRRPGISTPAQRTFRPIAPTSYWHRSNWRCAGSSTPMRSRARVRSVMSWTPLNRC